jgi:hypothetical protein
MIIGFIILFVVIGLFIGILTKEDTTAYGIIIAISVGWMFVMGPWAIATFIELAIGYTLGSKIAQSSNSDDSNNVGLMEKRFTWEFRSEEDVRFDDLIIKFGVYFGVGLMVFVFLVNKF